MIRSVYYDFLSEIQQLEAARGCEPALLYIKFTRKEHTSAFRSRNSRNSGESDFLLDVQGRSKLRFPLWVSKGESRNSKEFLVCTMILLGFLVGN